MAEVEMEQDASYHFPGLGATADEDLINYDSDTGGQHEGGHDIWTEEQAPNEAQETIAVSTDATSEPNIGHHKSQDDILLSETNNLMEPSLTTDAVELEPEAVEQSDQKLQDEDGVANTDEQIEHSKDTDAENIDFFATEDPDTGAAENAAETVPADEDPQEDHEIDYDMVESDLKEVPDIEGEPDVTNELVVTDESLLPASIPIASEHSPAHQNDDMNDAVEQVEQAEQAEQAEDAEDAENEITWDEAAAAEVSVNPDEADVLEDGAEDPEGEDPSQSGEKETEDMDEEYENVDEQAQDEQPETSQHVDDEEITHEGHIDAEPEHNHESEMQDVQGDVSVVGSGEHNDFAASESDNQEFPAITVQYKGDEFPFFSGSTEGFFSETSVLDSDMKSLMAGFRAELTNEIASDEELVFQIDELGLEFAESSLGETISGISLRQILEVFDLLVKNQDPDSSRVLYTYLFTRPSTSKRFESLIESATAGRGLDEVIHLFASPMPHGNRVVMEEQSAVDNFDEQLDSYESGEEVHEAEEGHGEELVEQATEEHDTLQHDEQHDEPGNDTHDTDADLTTAASSGHQEHESAEVTEAEELLATENEHHSATEEADHPIEGSDAIELNGETNELEDIQDSNTNEQVEGDDALVEDEEVPEGDNGPEIEVANQPAGDTGTTNTLDDDGDAKSPVLDDEVDFTADHEFTEAALAEDDELAEIDWRHESDDAPESLDATAGAGKRARTDDELGMEDDKDVKRRRP